MSFEQESKIKIVVLYISEATRMTRKLSMGELSALLDQVSDAAEDLDGFESLFQLAEDTVQVKPEDVIEFDSLAPKVVFNPDVVDTTDVKLRKRTIDRLNDTFKHWRQRRYERKIQIFERNRWPYTKIVAEGDSWFQFPLILDDVIDQIFEPRKSFLFNRDNPYAVYSLGEAGALLSDMVNDEEYLEGLQKIDPEWFLISGGGNDLLDGGKGVAKLVKKFPVEEPNRPTEDYIEIEKLNQRIQDVIDLYDRLFHRILDTSEFSQVKIICYGYDYARPRNKGLILGRRFEEQNISREETMFSIIRFIIDNLNTALKTLVDQIDSGRLFYVDCRGAVEKDEWFDDFHPKSKGYRSVARRILDKIESHS